MAHFAKINLNNKVTQVNVVSNEVITDANGNEVEQLGIDFLEEQTGYPNWVQCSYNKNFRGNYPSKGYIWDSENEIFWPPQPYPSWTKNLETKQWDPPVARPNGDIGNHKWDEENQSWNT
tara:strand:+ start:154 stop:513 length:360 start_codon:yes stop_codon:yes gene_type:complete